jgi:hypothetical protein
MQSKSKRISPTEKDIALLKMPPLSKSFPVTFPKGVTYTALSAFCIDCDDEISDENLHGEVTSVQPNMKQVEARGYCKKCNLITPTSYRLYSDGRFMGLRNGKWIIHQMKISLPWWKKLIKFLF